ncbi:Pkinase-domain-containing protein [Auricularia subglabra TFB-10046 SS5]|nr:Pkinase-domain-containing protein [Auricularia subglabra TFB-10046 SS5]
MAAVANGYLHNLSSGHSSTSSSPTSPSFHTTRALQINRPSTPSGGGAQAGGSVLLEPPQGVSYLDFVRQWSDAHVAHWLANSKCGGQAAIFADNDIRGDVVLDLDHPTLKEMGIVSIGERTRIINAVKQLRQKCHASKLITPGPPRVTLTNSAQAPAQEVHIPDAGLSRSNSKRGASGRPPPLTLQPLAARSDVELVRTTGHTPRPGVSTPSSAHHTPVQKERPYPPLPPAPVSKPPQPPSSSRSAASAAQQLRGANGNLGLPAQPAPGRRTPTPEPAPPPSYTNQPLPPAPTTTPATPGHGWGLPSNPSPWRTGSPSQGASTRTQQQQQRPPAHQKSSSLSRPTGHPYAIATLEPPSFKANDLSPIAESFMSPAGQTPSTLVPPSSIIRGRPTTPHSMQGPTLDDLRRKTMKFILDGGGPDYSRVVNVQDCERGFEVLERALKKFGKSVTSEGEQEYTPDGGLVLDGYAAFYDDSIGDGKPLTEGQLLAVCNADPAAKERDPGLHLRLIYPRSRQTTDEMKKMHRASSISILSSLGVRDPEGLLAADDAPVPPKSSSPTNKPSKLRNFFGQRPPSELITNHLAEFFPGTERKVLERTARHSMMRQSTISTKRESRMRTESSATWLPPPSSRFSTSTVGSRSRASMETIPRGSTPPPLPDKHNSSGSSNAAQSSPPGMPRMSLSTEEGESVDLTVEEAPNEPAEPHQLLPPVPISEPLAFPSLERRSSTASRRLSYLSQLRAQRDTSDTASMLTLDEITQEVESRRASWIGQSGHDGSEDDTLAEEYDEDEDQPVNPGGAQFVRKPSVGLSAGARPPVPLAGEVEEEEEDEGEDGGEVDNDEETLEGEEAGRDKVVKWIRGALIGAGSFGSVYLGMNKVNGTLMAVKQVELPTKSSSNEERKKSMLTALEREIDLLKQLQHENIVQYLDSSMDDQYLNIFLEYVPGGSVAALLKNYGAFEETLVRNFVRQILQGLNYLHEREIIHRDIKGANILVDNKGGIKISDFGISKKVADNLLSTARVNRPSLQGSVFWMAPEVVKQTSYTRKADIWSLGCLVVEMFTGEHPYPKLNQMQAIFKIGQSAKPSTPEDISSDAEDFLTKTFEIDYQARPSAAELLLDPWIIKDPANPASKKSGKTASDA